MSEKIQQDKTPIKLDILAFGPHPDDVEEGCSGFLHKARKLGKKTGIVDLTQGEMSDRGTLRQREKETRAAAKILRLSMRENLGLPDTMLENNFENRRKVIEVVRKYQPETILVPVPFDIHSDHIFASEFVSQAAFLADLKTIETEYPPFRPRRMFFYFLNGEVNPTFILDIAEEFASKMEAVKAFVSQYTQKDFKNLEIRARYWGQKIGVEFGEPYWTPSPVGFSSPEALLTQSF